MNDNSIYITQRTYYVAFDLKGFFKVEVFESKTKNYGENIAILKTKNN